MRAYNLGYPDFSLAKDALILSRAMRYQPDLVVWLVTLRSMPTWIDTHMLIATNSSEAQRLELYRPDLPLLFPDQMLRERRDLADLIRLQLYGVMWAATGVDQHYPDQYEPLQKDFDKDDTFFNLKQPLQESDLAFHDLATGKRLAGNMPLIVVNEPMFISDGQEQRHALQLLLPALGLRYIPRADAQSGRRARLALRGCLEPGAADRVHQQRRSPHPRRQQAAGPAPRHRDSMNPNPLTFTSCQAPIAEFTMQAVAEYLGHKLGIATRYINTIDWPERFVQLDANQIDVGWICSTPYIHRHDTLKLNIELLAAPVMAAPRYQNRPVYFSDVVVRSDSRFRTFDDLRGASWAYNEPSSQSGYHCVRWFLAEHNLDGRFFGRVIESGAHANSLNLILSGAIDASAIDATVLEMRLAHEPALQNQIRVIAGIGPSPIPPYVIGKHVPTELRHALRHALTHMHEDANGLEILQHGQLAHFAEVTDTDYDRTRQMLRLAGSISLRATASLR